MKVIDLVFGCLAEIYMQTCLQTSLAEKNEIPNQILVVQTKQAL